LGSRIQLGHVSPFDLSSFRRILSPSAQSAFPSSPAAQSGECLQKEGEVESITALVFRQEGRWHGARFLGFLRASCYDSARCRTEGLHIGFSFPVVRGGKIRAPRQQRPTNRGSGKGLEFPDPLKSRICSDLHAKTARGFGKSLILQMT